MQEKRYAAREQIDQMVNESSGTRLVRRAVVDEKEEYREMREPKATPQELAHLVGNRGVIEYRNELSNASLANGDRMATENRERIRGVTEVAKQGSKQLSVASKQVELRHE